MGKEEGSMIERMDAFSGALPRKCLWCRYGYPVVFGTDDWLSCFACGANVVTGLRSKRLTLKLTERDGGRKDDAYAPLVGAGESCESFKPVRWCPAKPGEYCNTRKLVLLDRSGMLEGMEG